MTEALKGVRQQLSNYSSVDSVVFLGLVSTLALGASINLLSVADSIFTGCSINSLVAAVAAVASVVGLSRLTEPILPTHHRYLWLIVVLFVTVLPAGGPGAIAVAARHFTAILIVATVPILPQRVLFTTVMTGVVAVFDMAAFVGVIPLANRPAVIFPLLFSAELLPLTDYPVEES